MNIRIKFIHIVLIVSVSSALSCAASKSKSAVEEFHRLYNDGKYTDIYAASTPSFRVKISEPAFVTLLSNTTKRLGSYKSSATYNINTTSIDWTVSEVELVYESDFATGTATERFVFTMINRKPVLSDFAITIK